MDNKIIATIVSNTGGKNEKSEGKNSLFEQIEKKWSQPIKKYKKYHSKGFLSNLGDIQEIKIDQRASMKIYNVFLIAIHENNEIDENHLKQSLERLLSFASLKNASIHLCYDTNVLTNISIVNFQNLLSNLYSNKHKIHSFIYYDKSDNSAPPPIKKRKIQEDQNQDFIAPSLNNNDNSSSTSNSKSNTNFSLLNANIFKTVHAVIDGFSDKEKNKISALIIKCGGK